MSKTTTDAYFRLFVAIVLPERLRADIGRLLGRFRREGVQGGLVRVENIHLSLQFLGDVRPETVPALEKGLSDAATGVTRFDLVLGELGTFGRPRSPRVVWLGTSEPGPLVQLAAAVRQAAQACGIAVDDRPFKSHITLARIRHARQRAPMLRAIEAIRVPDFGSFHVDTMHLVRSRLTPTGPVYESLAELALA